VRIFGSSQSRSSLRKGVRDFYPVLRGPATRSSKEIQAILLSTGPSTTGVLPCTEKINFSTVPTESCGRGGLGSKALRAAAPVPPTNVAGVEPEPDTKDWTWVLTRRCEQCGLAVGEIDPATIAERAFVAAEEWVQILRSSPAVTARPKPDVWSPLEYGAHVRDVYRIFDKRLALMLAEDEPTFVSWDQNQTAIEERYSQQDPEVVAEELEAAAQVFVARIQAVKPEQWDRRARRSDGAEFTTLTLCQYFLHDVIHHLWDVTGQQDGAASLVVEAP
jgi:hypothetical protein